MLRRRSLSVQPSSPTESLTNRSSSFVLKSSPRGDNGDVFCRDAPLFIPEPSPRRPAKTRFRIPGVGMIRAGLAGIRRHKQISLKKQCVWVDTPKEELLEVLHKQRAKSTTALRDRPADRDISLTEDLDILINDGVFHLPRTGPLQRSMFTLSRVRESETTDDNRGELSATRTKDGSVIKMRSSASSMANMTPRRPPRSHRGPSAVTSKDPFSPTSSELEMQQESHSNQILKIESAPNAMPEATPVESPMATAMERPATRMDSRLGMGQVSVAVSPDFSDLQSECSEHYTSLNSFRSDQVLFHNSLGYKQLRVDTGLVLTGRSEENACIGQRPSESGRRSSDLRRVKFHGNEIPKERELEVEDTRKAETASEVSEESESEQDSQGDDCSVMEEPRNLSMWMDWLEERSNVTRKEIMYRMGCQRAFVQEARNRLRSHALAEDELEDVCQPRMKDRLAVLQRCCIDRVRKGHAARRALGIDDDEITDINFNDVMMTLSH